MRTDELDYTLPEDLIATRPAGRREDARLMVVRRADPASVEHRRARDLPEYVRAGDAVVLNDSRVLRARLRGRRADTGGKVEGLYLGPDHARPAAWRVMLRSNGKLRPGTRVELLGEGDARAEITLLEPAGGGEWAAECGEDEAALERLGLVPLPPYILQARRARGEAADDPADAERYQTVYAAPEKSGSVAAPTAGLHLTPDLLARLAATGASVSAATLHVGPGTFRPVETDTLEAHAMHAERIDVPAETLAAIDRARAAGGKCLAVGTTTARALESVPSRRAGDFAGETDLLIAPGYAWKRVDALLTNFHLPRSTLLAMVAALFPHGARDLLPLYELAVRERYRFYSYGDAMLIL